MSLIWNNTKYKLVSDDSEWDQLDFVVARKLHIQYKRTQVRDANYIDSKLCERLRFSCLRVYIIFRQFLSKSFRNLSQNMD